MEKTHPLCLRNKPQVHGKVRKQPIPMFPARQEIGQEKTKSLVLLCAHKEQAMFHIQHSAALSPKYEICLCK